MADVELWGAQVSELALNFQQRKVTPLWLMLSGVDSLSPDFETKKSFSWWPGEVLVSPRDVGRDFSSYCYFLHKEQLEYDAEMLPHF